MDIIHFTVITLSTQLVSSFLPSVSTVAVALFAVQMSKKSFQKESEPIIGMKNRALLLLGFCADKTFILIHTDLVKFEAVLSLSIPDSSS